MGQKKKLKKKTTTTTTKKNKNKNETTRRKRKRKAKAMVTIERHEHTLQAITAPQTDNSVKYVASTTIMHHFAESVPNPKRDLRRPRESESRKQQRLRRQAVTQGTAQHLQLVNKIRSLPNQDTVLIRSGHIDVFVEPDSGASANLMDEYQVKAPKHRSQEIRKLEPSRDTLKTFQSNVTVEFTATSEGTLKETNELRIIQQRIPRDRLPSRKE